jgi:hypothetical protein
LARRFFQATAGADSGEGDRPFRPKVITDSGDRDHLDPLGGGPG